jgi:hypothetical protein
MIRSAFGPIINENSRAQRLNARHWKELLKKFRNLSIMQTAGFAPGALAQAQRLTRREKIAAAGRLRFTIWFRKADSNQHVDRNIS